MKKHIPNLITLLNLTSGFIAIIYASQGEIVISCYLILAGMVFDFADGFSARLLKAYSAIGKDLDSLADVITFGAAPGVIIHHLLAQAGLPLVPAFAAAAVFTAASALRLAIFNNDSEQKTFFKGMATPASAFTVISLVLASAFSDQAIYDTLISSSWFICALSLFLAVMMLLKTRMFSFKFAHLRIRDNEERYLFIFTGAILFIAMGLAALPVIMMTYIVISFLFAFLRSSGR